MEATFAVVIDNDCGLEVIAADDAICRPPAVSTIAVSFVPEVTFNLMV